MLAEQDGEGVRPDPAVGREQPGEGLGEHVHAAVLNVIVRRAAAGGRRTRPRHEGPPEEDQQEVDDQGDDDDGDDAGEDLGEDAALEAVREQVAEVRDADEDADRRERDGAHRRHSEAREDDRPGEWEVDRPEAAEPAVAHRDRGLPDRGVDRVQAVGHRADEDRDRVDRQADDEVGRAARRVARHRRQQDQEGEGGDRVEQPCQDDDRTLHELIAPGHPPQWERQHETEHDRDRALLQVHRGELEDQPEVVADPVHGAAFIASAPSTTPSGASTIAPACGPRSRRPRSRAGSA